MSSTMSLQYSHVILVSGYLVFTAVNWPWNWCPMISNCKDVNLLTQLDQYIFFGCHLAGLHCLIHILRYYIWACDMVSKFTCFDSCQLTWISKLIKLMWTLMLTKPAWLRLTCLGVATAVVVVRDSTCPRATLLAMLTMKK